MRCQERLTSVCLLTAKRFIVVVVDFFLSFLFIPRTANKSIRDAAQIHQGWAKVTFSFEYKSNTFLFRRKPKHIQRFVFFLHRLIFDREGKS